MNRKYLKIGPLMGMNAQEVKDFIKKRDNMKKTNKITKDQFDSLYSDTVTKKQYDDIIELINGRVNYIVEELAISKGRRFWWDFDNCQYDCDESGGEFEPERYKEYIGIGGEDFDFPEPYDLGDNGCSAGFPTRWLWEDFEEEFKSEVKKFKDEKLALKEKTKQQTQTRKQKNEALKASAKAKLTPEEWKAVRLK